MTLEDLRAFVVTYQAESMSEAARRLGCTQGAIAQHVRRLENELGTELFARMRRGVAPTSSGKILYDVASGALGNLELAVREIVGSKRGREDRLRIAVSAIIMTSYLRNAALALRDRRPSVEIEIVSEHTTERRIDSLREGRADLALIAMSDPPRSIEIRPYREVPLALAVHPEHPFAGRGEVDLCELAAMSYIGQTDVSSTFQHIEHVLREAGIAFKPTLMVAETETALLMVELGRGETLFPVSQAERLIANHKISVVRVRSLPAMPLVWAARSFALLPDAALEFVELCDDIPRGD